MGMFKSFERGLAWGIGRELAYGASRGARLTKAQREALAAIEERKALLTLGYVNERTVLAYAGDAIRFADTSQGATVLVEGHIVGLSWNAERVKVRLPLANGKTTDKWAERLYLEVLPRPSGWVAPPNAKSALLLKSPEWF